MRVGDITALLREWAHRLIGAVLRRQRSDGDLAQEIAFHLEQAELDLRKRGYSAQEARRLARALTGNSDGAIEALRAQGGVPWIGTFTLDVTLGLRMLRKYWGLSLVGGLALAVVIGICTVVFLYFNLVGSTALPIEEGDRFGRLVHDLRLHRPCRDLAEDAPCVLSGHGTPPTIVSGGT